MDFKKVNFWAVIVATMASFAWGAIWYGPFLGQAWLNAMGKTMAQLGDPTLGWILGLAATLVMATSLSMLMNSTNMSGSAGGIKAGLMVSLTFIIMATLLEVAFDKTSWVLWGIHSGFEITSFSIMGAILGLMPKKL